MTTLQLTVADGIARLVFDQASSKVNVLSRAAWADFAAALAELKSRDDIRSLLLSSAKPGIFLAGADLRELDALPIDDPVPTQQVLKAGHDALSALESLPFPTVAAIDGACLGGGLEVALACDARIVGTHPKVKIGLPEVKLGLIPGWGGTQRLPRVIGGPAAAELLVTGESLDGPRAKDMGLVQDVIESDRLGAAAVELLAKLDTAEIRRMKSGPRSAGGPLGEWMNRASALPDAERVAATTALQVMALGAPVPLTVACGLESAAFVKLLATSGARGRIAGFLKRPG